MARIAVCDDSTKYRRNLVDYLQEQDFQAFGFATPGDLMDALNNGISFDCILMDLYFDDENRQPKLEGIDAGIQINPQNQAIDQLSYATPGTPIIFISGNLSDNVSDPQKAEEYEAECNRIGIDFMTKPIKFPVLIAKLRKAITTMPDTQQAEAKVEEILDQFRLDESQEKLVNVTNGKSAKVRNHNLENIKILMERAGEYVSYNDLGGQESAQTSICSIRATISNDLGSKAKPIKTKHTKGYKWLPEHGTV